MTSINTTKKLKKGHARIQFIACKNRISELCEEGYDIHMMYQKLRQEGLITMSYGGFYENYTQRRRNKKIEKTEQLNNSIIASQHQAAITKQVVATEQPSQVPNSGTKTGTQPKCPSKKPTGGASDIDNRRRDFLSSSQQANKEAEVRSRKGSENDDPKLVELRNEII